MAKKKDIAQSFDEGFYYKTPILKFGPGEKDPYKGSKKRRQPKPGTKNWPRTDNIG